MKDENEIVERVDRVEQKVDTLEEKVDRNAHKIDLNSQRIEENGRRIEENGRKIEENGRRLDRVEQKVEENGQRLDRVEATLQVHSEHFAFIIEKLNENQNEVRRLFGVKDEQHASDLKGLGEGVKSNRERLDNHEERLEDLEAS